MNLLLWDGEARGAAGPRFAVGVVDGLVIVEVDGGFR